LYSINIRAQLMARLKGKSIMPYEQAIDDGQEALLLR